MLVTKGSRLVGLPSASCAGKEMAVEEDCASGGFVERLAFALERALPK